MTKYLDIFIYPNAVGLDITGPLEVFNTVTLLLRRDGLEQQAYQPRICAEQVGTVRLNSGITLMADFRLADLERSDLLMIPGAVEIEQVLPSAVLREQMIDAAARTKRLVSVCTGAFMLAACGLLDNRRVTTHWASAVHLAQMFPKTRVVPDAIYVRDGEIATSAGVTAGIDLALALVEEDYGADLAIEVARWLVLYLRRPGSQAQYSLPLKLQQKAGQRFRSLHHWLSENLSETLSVEAMAEQMDMSPRNFSRVFSNVTGMTPGKYIEAMRLERARELLENSKEAINRVAEMSGFGREERMRRAFIRELGVTPGLYQRHFCKPGSAVRP